MKWLGLDWDEGPKSAANLALTCKPRFDTYKAALEKLKERAPYIPASD